MHNVCDLSNFVGINDCKKMRESVCTREKGRERDREREKEREKKRESEREREIERGGV